MNRSQSATSRSHPGILSSPTAVASSSCQPVTWPRSCTPRNRLLPVNKPWPPPSAPDAHWSRSWARPTKLCWHRFRRKHMNEHEILHALRTLSTTDLSDALDRLGIAGQCMGIMPLVRTFQLVGRAFTVHYVPVGVERGSVGDYIDDLGPDDVVVLDNAGRLDATVWGDLLTSTAARRQVGGTVIDGVCRDVDRALELDYPIYSRGNWMRTGKDRVRVDGIN